MLFPSPPSSVDCVELKLECITTTLHPWGQGKGKTPQFDGPAISFNLKSQEF